MPAPLSYTEPTLADYMVGALGSVAATLGLSTSSPAITSAVTAVEDLLGVADVATVTDMPLLRAAARWEAWKAAKGAASGRFDVKAGAADVKLSQTFEQIAAMLADAETAYYAQKAASDAASGGSSPFYFGLAAGCRGR